MQRRSAKNCKEEVCIDEVHKEGACTEEVRVVEVHKEDQQKFANKKFA